MISSSRIYLTWPVCLPNRRSIPICLPFFFILSSAAHHFILPGILQYFFIYLWISLIHKKIIRVFRRTRFNIFVSVQGCQHSGKPQLSRKRFLTPGFQIKSLTTTAVFSKNLTHTRNAGLKHNTDSRLRHSKHRQHFCIHCSGCFRGGFL